MLAFGVCLHHVSTIWPIGIGSKFLEPLATAGLVTALVIFMLLARGDLRNRLIRLVGYGQLTLTTKALDEAGQRISCYLFMHSLVNGSHGAILGIGLFLIGLPYALLWGGVRDAPYGTGRNANNRALIFLGYAHPPHRDTAQCPEVPVVPSLHPAPSPVNYSPTTAPTKGA
jgi:hypothetical protein